MYGTSAAIFSLLLILTGFAKMRAPRDVARAISALGFPNQAAIGVLLGLTEVSVGAAALLVPAGLVAQAGLYAVFAGWISIALRRDVPLASCGCLGKDDTPPTWAHLVMNSMAVVVTLAAVTEGPVRLLDGVGVVAQVVMVATGVLLAYIVLTDGARLVGVRAR